MAVDIDDPQKIVHSSSEEQLILEKLLKNYDQRVRPPPTNSSGIIKCPVIDCFVKLMCHKLNYPLCHTIFFSSFQMDSVRNKDVTYYCTLKIETN